MFVSQKERQRRYEAQLRPELRALALGFMLLFTSPGAARRGGVLTLNSFPAIQAILDGGERGEGGQQRRRPAPAIARARGGGPGAGVPGAGVPGEAILGVREGPGDFRIQGSASGRRAPARRAAGAHEESVEGFPAIEILSHFAHADKAPDKGGARPGGALRRADHPEVVPGEGRVTAFLGARARGGAAPRRRRGARAASARRPREVRIVGSEVERDEAVGRGGEREEKAQHLAGVLFPRSLAGRPGLLDLTLLAPAQNEDAEEAALARPASSPALHRGAA